MTVEVRFTHILAVRVDNYYWYQLIWRTIYIYMKLSAPSICQCIFIWANSPGFSHPRISLLPFRTSFWNLKHRLSLSRLRNHIKLTSKYLAFSNVFKVYNHCNWLKHSLITHHNQNYQVFPEQVATCNFGRIGRLNSVKLKEKSENVVIFPNVVPLWGK